jgi:phage tail-like protein
MPGVLLIALFAACIGEVRSQSGHTKDVDVHFRVRWDGKIIPGITKVSGLKRITEAVEHRAGIDANLMRYSPGISKYAPIVLERPRTHDKEFERWSNKVWNLGSGFGAEVSLRDYRKDIVIEIHDDRGNVLMAFHVYRCWPSEYIGLTGLDTDSDAPAMEVLILHHEGWERDYEVE